MHPAFKVFNINKIKFVLSDVENGDVFVPSPIPSISSSSSVGSIIDLVSTPSSTPRMWQHYITDDVYAEICDDKQLGQNEKPLNHDEIDENRDKTGNFDPKPSPSSFTNNVSANDASGKYVEPIYSVVIKPKRKKDADNKPNDSNSSSKNNSHKEKNFYDINTLSQTSGSNSSDSNNLTPLRSQRFIFTEKNSDVIDESMKAKPNQFVVIPSKTFTLERGVTSPSNNELLPTNESRTPNEQMKPFYLSNDLSRLSIGSTSDGSQSSIQESTSSSPRDPNHPSRPFVINSAAPAHPIYLD